MSDNVVPEEAKDTTKPLNKTPIQIITERVGKIKEVEVYTSKTEFVVVFPTDYSIVVRDTGSRKRAKVEVYYGVGEVTQSFFPGKTAKKVKREIVLALLERLSKEEAIDLIKKEVLT